MNEEIHQLRQQRQQLLQRRNTLAQRSLGRRIGKAGSGMYHVVRELDDRIEELERRLETAGYTLQPWERTTP